MLYASPTALGLPPESYAQTLTVHVPGTTLTVTVSPYTAVAVTVRPPGPEKCSSYRKSSGVTAVLAPAIPPGSDTLRVVSPLPL